MDNFNKKLAKNSKNYLHKSVLRSKARPHTSAKTGRNTQPQKDASLLTIYGKNSGINFKIDSYPFSKKKTMKKF